MRKKLISAMLCVTMAASFMLTSCESNNDSSSDASEQPSTEEVSENPKEEQVKLSIYAQYADDDTKIPYDYAVEELKKEYPNVELELIVQSQDDGMTLSTLAATDSLPDIFQANTDIINSFRETGQIMDLSQVANDSGFKDKVFDSCKELLYADDGKIYAFPYAGQEYVLWYYNKALFEKYDLEIPTTYDDLTKCIEVFKENDIVPMSLFGQEGWNSAAMYDAIATRYTERGIKALDKQEANITDQPYVDATNKMNEFVKAGMFSSDVTNTNYDQASALFLEGKAAMFLNGQWFIPDATEALGDDVDWMFYPAPTEESYKIGREVFSGGGSTSGYAVNPDSEHAELAAEVAEFITEKYCESKILNGKVLVSIDTGLESEKELPAMMQKLTETIPTISATTKFTWGLTNNVFNTALSDQTRFLLSPQYTPAEFTKEMSSAMDRMND